MGIKTEDFAKNIPPKEVTEGKYQRPICVLPGAIWKNVRRGSEQKACRLQPINLRGLRL